MPAPSPSPIGAISFPHLFTPRPPSPGADDRYSVSVIFDETAQSTPEYKTMKAEVMRVAKDKWGDKAADMFKNGQLRSPFREASEKSQYAGYEDGKIFVNAWSSQKPDVIDGRLQDVVPSDVFAGCLARITYGAFAWDTAGNKGVSIGLNNLQITDFNGERLDGKKRGSQDFDAMDMPDGGQSSGSDDLDDDLPF